MNPAILVCTVALVSAALTAVAAHLLKRAAGIEDEQPPAPVVVPDDLTALADVLREWPRCDNCGGYPGNPPEPCIHPPRPLTLADHGLAWSPPEPVQIDPPTTRPYAVPDALPDMTLIRVGRRDLHRECVDARRDGRTVRACCAPLLARSATEVQW